MNKIVILMKSSMHIYRIATRTYNTYRSFHGRPSGGNGGGGGPDIAMTLVFIMGMYFAVKSK
jgi:hypothetical protein